MQNLGYDMGITASRYPLAFKRKPIDFNPKRMVMESNRCILCHRCVEEVRTNDGKSVFALRGRGVRTRVAIDYEQEAKLSESEAMRAMSICPVGAILVKGKAAEEPFGDRKYDLIGKDVRPRLNGRRVNKKKSDQKFVVATTSLAGCFGCHMSLLDVDLGLLDIIEIVEFNKSPLNDIKSFSKRAHVGLIEGGCANSENVKVLREFRKKCDFLISFGECAIMGGIPAMRNFVSLQECLEEAYLHSSTCELAANVIPGHEDLPKLLDKVYPCSEIVRIDYHIPGCPPSAAHIWKIVSSILDGKETTLARAEFKYD